MDPDVTLEQLRTMVARLRRLIDSANPDRELLEEKASEVVDLFDGLDNWLKRGGCLPRQWLSVPVNKKEKT